MPATYLFSAPELHELILSSRAMSALNADIRATVLGKVANPSSVEAHQLYEILITERDTYKNIQRDYLKKTGAIMTDFQNDITQLKTEKLRHQQQATESQAAAAESKTADALINSLNNPHS